MRKETAWFVGGAALAAATAAGASVWSQYGSLVRWQEPELPIQPTTRQRHTYTYKIVHDRPLQFDLYLPPWRRAVPRSGICTWGSVRQRGSEYGDPVSSVA